MTDTKVGIIITAKDQAGAVFKNLQKESGAFSKNAVKHFDAVKKRVLNLRTALVGLGGLYVLRRLTKEWERLSAVQEKAEAGMLQAMKSMGRYTPELHAQLVQVSQDLQDMTTFGDEAVLGGQKFLLTYRDITDDVLPRASATMTDIAALMGGDMRQAANMLGKASMGMTGELRRVGITVDEDTYKTKGFLGVLEQIESQVRGQAAAMRATKAGGMEMFGNYVDDAKEKVGTLTTTFKWSVAMALLPSVRDLNDALEDVNERFAEWITNNDELIKQKVETWVDGVTESIKRMYSTYKSLPEGVIGAGGVGLIVAIVGKSSKIGALAAAIALLNTELSNFDLNITSLPEKYRELDKAIDNIWDVITGKREWRTGQLLNEEGRPYVRGPIIKTATGPEGTGTETGGGAGTPGPTNWVEDLTDEEVAAYKRGWEQEEHLLSVYLDNKKTMIDDAAEAQKRAYEYEEMLVNRYLENKQTAIDEADEYYSQMIDDLNSKHLDTSNYMIELSERTAEAMEQNFSDLFFDMMRGEFDDLGDYADAVLQSIQRAAADLLGQLAREGLFGIDNKSGILGGIISGIGAWFGGSSESMIGKETIIGHGGGVIGQDKFASRRVNPAIFATAQRAHSGLGPGEKPIIARDNEGIFTPGQMNALGASINLSSKNTGGDMHLHLDAIHIHATDAKSFYELAARNPGAIVQPFISAIESGDKGLINRIKGVVY